MAKVSVVMGSKSDSAVLKDTVQMLRKFGIEYEIRVLSAHRTPMEIHDYIVGSDADLFIAAAGKAAHLGGVIAAYTVKPVIGIPVKSSTMDGLDSLLSMVQMPSGVPVACVAINGAANAAILAAQILAVSDEDLKSKLIAYKKEMAKKVLDDDASIADEF